MPRNAFHEGELAVQRRAGRVLTGRIRDTFPPVAAEFASRQLFCVAAGRDEHGHVWTTMLAGPSGFMSADDDRTLHVRARPAEDDPLHRLLTEGGDVGVIIMDSRRRMRVNGVLSPAEDGFVVRSDQVFSNCGRYISERLATPVPARRTGAARQGVELLEEQQELIERADTFFVGTRHPDGAADASHRGGNPGFVRVTGPRSLHWPDYDGNAMFMTLGNLQLDPRVGLLFVDWAEGSLLHVTGQAEVDWEPAAASRMPGALRVVRMTVDAVRQRDHAVGLRWAPPVLSRYNPAPEGPSDCGPQSSRASG
ncbi:MAG TPA: pyridoxamine 5'-phosphate oxidase family protein [Actinomycetales bacterium]|nr:pyridoxamine 5'-phosphate oxidase family protein [Actinomycetales bacterium]